MEAGIRCGGGRASLGGFYRARAARRCRGKEMVWHPATVGASMYRLWEWRRGSGGGETEGRPVARRGRGGSKVVSAVTLHGTMACSRSQAATTGLKVGEESCWAGLTNWLRLLGKNECWAENGGKNKNLDYEFWVVDLEFGDDMAYYVL
jgi:hypothetical protein